MAVRRISECLCVEDERPFIHKALSQKLGDADRLVYAKIVEARDPERAEWLRLEVTLHARGAEDLAVIARFVELSRAIGPEFVHELLRNRIMNCGLADAIKAPQRVRFAFACPKRWETLVATEDEAVRHCQHCNERVYYCSTVADAETRAYAGQCVAIPKHLSDGGVQSETLGRPEPTRDWADRLFSYGPGAPKDAASLLVVYSTDDEMLGRSFTLNPAGVSVGRGLDNAIVLRSDGVSRCHARLEKREDGWWVIDAGSMNGIYIHSEKVQEHRLLQGDMFQLSGTIFKFVARG